MLRPSLEEFEACSKRGNLIPVVREILADLDTPLSLFRRIDDGRTSFLLESVEGGEKWARYSFMGTGARANFTCPRVATSPGWSTPRAMPPTRGRSASRVSGDPLEFLRDKLRGLHHVTPEGFELAALPRRGRGHGRLRLGALRRAASRDANPDELGLPDLCFVLPETVVVYDNIRHTALIVRHVAAAARATTRSGAMPRRAARSRRRCVGCAQPLAGRADAAAGPRAHGRRAQHDPGGLPRDRRSGPRSTSRRATSSRWCCRSSSGFPCRWTPSRSTGTCARSTRAPTSSSCAVAGADAGRLVAGDPGASGGRADGRAPDRRHAPTRRARPRRTCFWRRSCSPTRRSAPST